MRLWNALSQIVFLKKPTFKWRVPRTVRKRKQVISKLKGKYWRTTHKFGIRLPEDVKETLEIDIFTGTYFWRKAAKKEMSKFKIAWKAEKIFTPEEFRSQRTNEYISFQ